MERLFPRKIVRKAHHTEVREVIVDEGAKPFTLQKIYDNYHFKTFTTNELKEKLKLAYKEFHKAAINQRLVKLAEKGWLERVGAGPNPRKRFRIGKWKLSKKSKHYLLKWGSFTNPEGPLMLLAKFKAGVEHGQSR